MTLQVTLLSIQCWKLVSFDLHVLSTPPAFVLSQDQTLHKIYEEPWLALNYLLKKLPIAMLFIPIDVLNKKLKVSQTSGLIMLHDYLHCLVFKEQSVCQLSASFASSDLFILSHSVQLVKNFFEVFCEALRFTIICQSRLAALLTGVCQRLVLYYTTTPSLSTFF